MIWQVPHEIFDRVQWVLVLLFNTRITLKLNRWKIFTSLVNDLGHSMHLAVWTLPHEPCMLYPVSITSQNDGVTVSKSIVRLRPFQARLYACGTSAEYEASKTSIHTLHEVAGDKLPVLEKLSEKLTAPFYLSLRHFEGVYSVVKGAQDQLNAFVLLKRHTSSTHWSMKGCSCALGRPERAFCTTYCERLGVVWAVQYLWPYYERWQLSFLYGRIALKWIPKLM